MHTCHLSGTNLSQTRPPSIQSPLPLAIGSTLESCGRGHPSRKLFHSESLTASCLSAFPVFPLLLLLPHPCPAGLRLWAFPCPPTLSDTRTSGSGVRFSHQSLPGPAQSGTSGQLILVSESAFLTGINPGSGKLSWQCLQGTTRGSVSPTDQERAPLSRTGTLNPALRACMASPW